MATTNPTELDQLLGSDLRHHLHPFTNASTLREGDVRLITRAEGAYIWDGRGNRILDGMAGLWCVNVGYGRKQIADAAYRQLNQLPYYNTFFKTVTTPAVELAEKLVGLSPAGMNHVFFTNSGSEANDTVVRMVRLYWELQGEPQKQVIISREFAYHGSTMAAASLGGMSAMHKQGGLPLPGFEHIMPPYQFARGRDMNAAEFGLQAARALEERILALGPENVAAFIGEPVQGAGGVIIPPDTYWPEIQRICREYGILLVADEVITGFGRLGNWFGSQTLSIQPDLMPIAKGLSSGYLPIAGVMVGDRVADTLAGEAGEFAHGFTYSGHPVSCAAALANLAIIEQEDLLGHVRTVAPYFNQRLSELADQPLVGEVRTKGLLGAIEMVQSKRPLTPFPAPVGKVGTLCRDHAFNQGLVMRGVRDSVVLSPPLIIDREQVDEMVIKARQALDLTARDMGVA